MNKTHVKRLADADEIDGLLCGAKVASPEFSDTPTCLRCRAILEREPAAQSYTLAISLAKRAPFVTVTGPRINPRNRHTASNPHVFDSSHDALRHAVSQVIQHSVLSRRQQFDIVSRRLNDQPSRASHIRVHVSSE